MMKAVKYMLVLCAAMALMTTMAWAQTDSKATASPKATKAAAAPTSTITAVDTAAKTVKAKDADGKETTYTVGDKCTIKLMKAGVASDGTLADLKKDMVIRVTGTASAPTAITAGATASDLKAPKKAGAKKAATNN